MALEVRDLTARLQGVPILFGVTFTVFPHQVVALLGKNGMGKTTTLKALAGLGEVTGGTFRIEGKDVPAELPAWRRRRIGLVYVPEDGGVFHTLTVAENLALGTTRPPQEAVELFPELERTWRRRAGVLSGGERKMLALARAWLSGARWFLVDEPSLGLSPAMLRRLTEALMALKSRGGVLLVEQNLALAEAVGERYVLLHQGRTVDEGPMARLRESPHFIEAMTVEQTVREAGKTSGRAHNGS